MAFHTLNFGFEDISTNAYLNNPVNLSLCKIFSIIEYALRHVQHLNVHIIYTTQTITLN